LKVTGTVPGVSQEIWDASVSDAEANCPISQVLKCAISSESTLS
jgi:osmotically inducible protein OsmC